MKGTPFSPLVAPPKEATYVDDLQPRRITSQLYAADGKFVDRSELITGPGGERGDKIPAMLSDGEFVVNAEAVRGMGVAAGADPTRRISTTPRRVHVKCMPYKKKANK